MSLHPPAPTQQTDTATQTGPGRRSKVNVKKAVGGSGSVPLGLFLLLVFERRDRLRGGWEERRGVEG